MEELHRAKIDRKAIVTGAANIRHGASNTNDLDAGYVRVGSAGDAAAKAVGLAWPTYQRAQIGPIQMIGT